MFNKTKNTMKVSCYLGKKKLCDLEWDEMPNIGMSFNYESRDYMITEINDSKITVKDISKKGSKRK